MHIFREVTEQLDISYLDGDFNGMGQYPHHPQMLLWLLIWGMANSVASTRRIEVIARRDVSFIYLAGGKGPATVLLPVPAAQCRGDKEAIPPDGAPVCSVGDSKTGAH